MDGEKITQDNGGNTEWDGLKDVEFAGGNEAVTDAGEMSKEELVQKTHEKISAKKKALLAFGAVACAAAIALGGMAKNKAAENTNFKGETAQGVHYDYSEYVDRDDKADPNAFGYDHSDESENAAEIERAREMVIEMAEREPLYEEMLNMQGITIEDLKNATVTLHETKNAGEHINPMSLDNEVTPPTTLEEDQQNFN